MPAIPGMAGDPHYRHTVTILPSAKQAVGLHFDGTRVGREEGVALEVRNV